MRHLIFLMLESLNWPKLHVLFKLNCSSVKLWFLYFSYSHVLVNHICPGQAENLNFHKIYTADQGGVPRSAIPNLFNVQIALHPAGKNLPVAVLCDSQRSYILHLTLLFDRLRVDLFRITYTSFCLFSMLSNLIATYILIPSAPPPWWPMAGRGYGLPLTRSKNPGKINGRRSNWLLHPSPLHWGSGEYLDFFQTPEKLPIYILYTSKTYREKTRRAVSEREDWTGGVDYRGTFRLVYSSSITNFSFISHILPVWFFVRRHGHT